MSDDERRVPEEQRARLAERFAEADVSKERFIDVHDTGKASTDHSQRRPDADALDGNYGVYGGRGADGNGRWLVDVDVDDYATTDDAATDGLDSLPETLTVESPHTDGETGGHQFYAVDGNAGEALTDATGKANPSPSWGEVRANNQYTVGAGSQISPGPCPVDHCDDDDCGCDKEWCDDCADDDKGYYRIADDRPVAVISPERFAGAIARDLEADTDDGGDDDDDDGADPDVDVATQSVPSDREFAIDTVLDYALEHDDKLAQLWNGRHRAAGYGDDRSEAESALAMKLAFWFQGQKRTVRDLMDRADAEKWAARDGDYHDSVLEAVDKQSDYFDPQTSDGSEIVETGDSGDGEHELPTPGLRHSFSVNNGGYGYWESNDDEPDEWNSWTNFQIEVDSFLEVPEGGEVFELTVYPRNADEYTVTVEPTAFNEKRQFKSEIACGRTTTFTGGERALAKIKQFVGTQAAPEQRGVRLMGRHDDDALVVPDGALTTEGWTDDPDTRYIERSLGIERKVGIGPDDDPLPDGELDTDRDSEVFEAVGDMLELLPETRDPERFLPVLGWFYAAPFRPLITDIDDDEFPVLSVTGTTGAGKTSTLETMWELLGVEGDPFAANGTSFTTMTTVSATDTLPVWFDEYKPSDMKPGRVDGFHDTIRKSTRGGVESKGNPDQTTTEYHLRAPVVVTGEQRFAGPAEQRRSVLTTFRDGATDPDSDEARAFTKLNGGSFREQDNQITHFDGYDLLDHAHVYHRWALLYDTDAVREAWHSAEETVLDTLDAYGVGDVDSAGRTALQTILFGIGVYRAFANDMGASVPFDQADRERAITYVAKQQGNDGRRESHLDEFVRLLSLTAGDTELEEDEQYTRTYDQSKGPQIRVNLSRAYPKVAQFVQNHGLADKTELLDKGDYRQRFKDQLGEEDSYVTAFSQRSKPVGRCIGIDAQDAEKVVDGFDGDHFYGKKEQGENGRYESDR